jgi:hypothetical protein
MLAWARDSIRDDSARRGVSPTAAELLFVVPAIGAVAVALAATHSGLFDFLVEEDSLLEWLQVPGFFGGFVFGLLLALHARRQRNTAAVAAYAIFAAACLFVAGEEISWGQRLLGLETPERLAELNNQDEVTVHNIVEIRVLFKFFLIALGLAGAVVPWLAYARDSRWLQVLPPLFTTSAFLLVFGYNAGRLVFFPEGFFGWEESFIVGKYGEWPETCLAAVAAGYGWLAWRARRRMP